jgi:hypothetical protein
MSGIFRHRSRYTAKPHKHRFDPRLVGTPDVFPTDEHLFFDDQMTSWTDFASLFPGDGTGYWNYQDVPVANTITPNGTQIVFVSNWETGVTSKASIQKEGYDTSNLFRFYAGDILDVVISMRIDGGAEDTTLLDFEFDPDYIGAGTNSPGPRVMVDNGKVGMDLSEIGGATIQGTQLCPIGNFFRLRMYLELSPESIGRTKVWVDGALSVDHSGMNMADKTVFAGLGVDFRLPTYIGRIEFGVTANQNVNPTMTVTTEYAQFRQRLYPRHGLSMMGCGKAVW